MHADTVVALASALVAAVIAVTVPWVTFRLAMRQDHVRWIREQRSQLYVDMLTEAGAEQDWLEQQRLATDKQRERAKGWYVDKRLPPLERARLGARGTIFGSRTVNHLFNQINTESFRLTMLTPGEPEYLQMVARVRIGGIVEDLNRAVRRELGTDSVPLNGGSPPDDAPRAPGWEHDPGVLPDFGEPSGAEEIPASETAPEPAPETTPDVG